MSFHKTWTTYLFLLTFLVVAMQNITMATIHMLVHMVIHMIPTRLAQQILTAFGQEDSIALAPYVLIHPLAVIPHLIATILIHLIAAILVHLDVVILVHPVVATLVPVPDLIALVHNIRTVDQRTSKGQRPRVARP